MRGNNCDVNNGCQEGDEQEPMWLVVVVKLILFSNIADLRKYWCATEKRRRLKYGYM